MIRRTINERYLLEKELGHGGMGTVFLAHDAVLDREVAIKLITGAKLGTEGHSRVLAEAQMVAKLKHANVVTVYDAGEFEGQAYVVMEYVQGTTLDKYDADGLDRIIEICIQICAALAHAHEHGIVHRDLKPENVIIEPDGKVRLMDFGLAVSTATRLTEDGMITGTVFYMSPEQAFGYEVTPQSDLYSLGVILYELSTARLPFEADDPLAVITQHIHAPAVPPRAKNENIPIPLNDLILSLLSKEPHDRPKSAAEVAELLDEVNKLKVEQTSNQELYVLDRIVRGRLVGRQQELKEARNLWQLTTARQGQALLVSGEPGIGKSSLTREVITNAEVSGGKAFIGECFEEINAPYNAFAQIIRQSLDLVSQNNREFPDSVLDDLLNLTPEQRYRFPNVVSNPKLDPETEQQRLFENMVTFCSLLSEEFPLLLIIEDAHWADSGTVRMLHHLVRRMRKQPLMILVTYREVELSESRPFNEMLLELNRQRQGTRIKLSRLDRAQTREMLSAIFAEQISDEFLDGIYYETEGNPFFIEEVCRALVENGALYFENGEWHRPSMEELEIPQGIQVAVESRISNLPKDQQEVLRMASILGREFDFDILLEALEVDEDDLIEALESAEEAQLIHEADGHGEVTFTFVHALVPSAIVESVRTLRRRRLHKKAAQAIERLHPQDYETLAYHFSEAGDETRAYKYYISAGERSAEAFANADAEEQFLDALDLVENERDQAYLFSQIGIAQANQSKFSEARGTLKQAIELYRSLGDLDKVAELYARSGRAAWSGGDTKLNLTICLEGLEVVEGVPEGPGIARLLAETSRACYFNGLHEDTKRYGQHALKMAEKLNLTVIQVETLTTLGLNPELSADDSLKMLTKAVDLAESNNLLRQAGRAHNNLGAKYNQTVVDIPNAVKHYQRAADIARQVGDSGFELFQEVNITFTYLYQGMLLKVAEAIPKLEVLIESVPDPGAGGSYFDILKASLLAIQGHLDQAQENLIKLHQDQLNAGSLQNVWSTLIFLDQTYFITGDIERGIAAAKEMIDLADRGVGIKSTSYSILSRFYSQAGELVEARDSLKKAVQEAKLNQFEFINRMFYLWSDADLKVAEKNWDEAWSLYADLIEFLDSKNFRWYKTRAVVDWAQAHLQRDQPGDWEKACQMLGEAKEEFEVIGADGFVKMVADQLAELGEES